MLFTLTGDAALSVTNPSNGSRLILTDIIWTKQPNLMPAPVPAEIILTIPGYLALHANVLQINICFHF